jgi:hypothetical protein
MNGNCGHYEKKRCFATSLTTQFLSCRGHLQLTMDMVQLIAIELQLCQNNSFSTTMQFHYNYTHDVMLMSLIVIHLLKFDTWHYEKKWTEFFFFFQNINLHRSL